MRQKSSKGWIYVVLAVVLVLALWAVSRDMPFIPEKVEQPLGNMFAQ